MMRLILLSLCLLLAAAQHTGGRTVPETADTPEARRANLLDMLTSPTMFEGDLDSGLTYSYRSRWQYYNACLAKGVKVAEANEYFATSDEIQADEWPCLIYIRTYFRFKDGVLSEAARDRLRGILREYKDRLDAPDYSGPGSWAPYGNHSINAYSVYLLLDEEFGDGPKHDDVRRRFIDWVQATARHSNTEVNSPHYLERSVLPLLNLYDFIQDPTIELWARMSLDQMIGDFALLSLKNVRGGPWCRAHQNHAPGVAEHNDNTQDSFYVMGYELFGGSALPPYHFTDQVLSYGFITTTGYRVPEVVRAIARADDSRIYEVKAHRSAWRPPGDEETEPWDMYYYVTPSCSLSCLQDRIELDNHVTGRITRDYRNTQVWELTFSDPMKILGPKRDLDVNTGERSNVVEIDSPNTANIQHRNVLFYKGQWMDYNANLAADGGEYSTEPAGDREFHFWRVSVPEGDVCVGVTHYPSAGAGILEVGAAGEHAGWEAFKQAVKSNPSTCADTGLTTTYTSTKGDTIGYDHGKATVNGAAWPLHDYGLYESPYVNSAFDSGVIQMSKYGKSLRLDFRDRKNPVRNER